ncbi:tRNA-splicing endonuclease subunit Sen2 [Vanessa tameamea]|uniref:tRNA-splicing endonuclease subunit Sen2 n=1 Tax=Vanessa tameamea TaxID=334116 RepID=A0A8B8IF39_VANTA|nr:tRNA-splicing endonuclease subunit Sen2 [Vanessa tameamea]XP_026495685.1 tRNA-splicing endonuclease subunit Sen2 [Vanessa tameamea]XP_026495686.1 tRNA-splicing endonuclease subunit Sen2 [Vanessa tameamea]XP_026495687.1 tRNA-splicing endonuclease subunit Sen2 [Vanessa tameamea]
MMSLKSEEECQTNDPNNAFPMDAESSLRLPLDSSMCIVFTGHYNGFGVEIRSLDEMALLHHMGCFGKGTASRSKPQVVHNDGSPSIMRKRQFLKRNYWHKRFGTPKQSIDSDSFLKEVNDLVSKIVHDTRKQSGRDVIDLVSSDDEIVQETEILNNQTEFDLADKQNLVVIVPNSDSEDDDYFANLKPKCCVDKIVLQEKLMLSLEEAFFLLYGLGCLQIVNNENNILNIEDCWKIFSESDRYFIEKYVVYHYFRSKGYIVKPGIKFGGDYLLYREGPEINHADYVIVINYGNNISDWISLLGQIRMAATTVKEVIIVEVLKSSKDNLKLPQDLSEFSVRELLLTRNIPNIINDGNDVD